MSKLIELAEAWAKAADAYGYNNMPEEKRIMDAAEAAFRAYVDTLQPDGRHVVVPIEPTPEMIRAAWLVCRANFSESEYNIAIYRAMIQAALQSDPATIAASPRRTEVEE